MSPVNGTPHTDGIGVSSTQANLGNDVTVKLIFPPVKIFQHLCSVPSDDFFLAELEYMQVDYDAVLSGN